MDGGLDFPSADIALQYRPGQVEHVRLYRVRKHLLKLVHTSLLVFPDRRLQVLPCDLLCTCILILCGQHLVQLNA